MWERRKPVVASKSAKFVLLWSNAIAVVHTEKNLILVSEALSFFPVQGVQYAQVFNRGREQSDTHERVLMSKFYKSQSY